MSRATAVAAVLSCAVLLAASTAHAYLGTFDPARQPYAGPRLVQIVDSVQADLKRLTTQLAAADKAAAE